MTVRTRVAARRPDAVDESLDDLAAAEHGSLMLHEVVDAMAHVLERSHSLCRNPFLECHGATDVVGVGAVLGHLGHVCGEADTRRVQGLLRAHVVMQHVEQHLHVTLRLLEAAHDATAGRNQLKAVTPCEACTH